MSKMSKIANPVKQMNDPKRDSDRVECLESNIAHQLHQLERWKKQTEYQIKCYEADIKVAKGLGWRCNCRDNSAECFSDDPIYVDNFNEWTDYNDMVAYNLEEDLRCKNCKKQRLPCYERGAMGLGHPYYDMPFKTCEGIGCDVNCLDKFDIRTDKYVVELEEDLMYCMGCVNNLLEDGKTIKCENRTKQDFVDLIEYIYGKMTKKQIADEFDARKLSYHKNYDATTKKDMISWIVLYAETDRWFELNDWDAEKQKKYYDAVKFL